MTASQRMHRAVCCSTLVVGICLLLSRPLHADDRPPIPSGAAMDEAMRLVKDVYGDEYTKAESSEQKTAFAQKLLQTSRGTEQRTANHYALLRVAWDVATQTGDAKLAIQITDEIVGVYNVNPLSAKVATVRTTAELVRSSAQRTALAALALELVREAVADDDYDSATELAEISLAAARKARDWQLVKRIVARTNEVKEAAVAYGKVQKTLVTLESNPTDAEANQVAGEYSCFVKGDWQKGIPMLALGSDHSLRALAQKELKGTSSAQEQADLGDGWWDVAQTRQGAQREALLLHAGRWYREAKPGISSALILDKIEKRLNEIAGLDRPTAESTSAEPLDDTASAKVGAAAKTGTPGGSESPAAPNVFARRHTVIAVDNHAGESGRFSAKNIYSFASPRPLPLGETAVLYQAHGAAAHDTNGTISLSLDGNTWQTIGQWTEADMKAAVARQNWHRVDFSDLKEATRANQIFIKFEYTSGGQKLSILRAVWVYEGK